MSFDFFPHFFLLFFQPLSEETSDSVLSWEDSSESFKSVLFLDISSWSESAVSVPAVAVLFDVCEVAREPADVVSVSDSSVSETSDEEEGGDGRESRT